jgi:hypothetical protein
MNSTPSRRTLILISFTLAALAFLLLNPFITSHSYRSSGIPEVSTYTPIRPTLHPLHKNKHDPIQWLRENSNDRHAIPENTPPRLSAYGRPRAAIISLVRNSELPGMMQSIRQLENRWNHKYHVSLSRIPFLHLLITYSIHGFFSTMNHLRRSSRQGHRTRQHRNATLQSFRRNIGRFPHGLMRVGL